MLDPDISTGDARRLLCVDDAPQPGTPLWSRRRFLQAVGAGVLGGAALGGVERGLLGASRAWAGAPIGPNDGVLVTLMLYGGNDGLNTVVPYTDAAYYQRRPGLAIAPDRVLPLDGAFGLHPNLPYLKQLWDAGQLGIVHGSGYPDPDLSHFTSMGIWMHGGFGGAPGTGWIGRWLDGRPGTDDDLVAASIGTSVPLHLIGAQRRAVAIPEWGDLFGTDTEPSDARMYAGLRAMSAAPAGRGPWHDMYARTLAGELDLARDVAPVFDPPAAGDGLVKRMTVAARLINADLGLRVVDLGADGYDTHDGEPWKHDELMTELNDAVSAFYATLLPTFRDRVTILTMSEFGRTLFVNDSSGTDHGTANVQFVIGSRVRGGHFGEPPSLATSNQWERLVSTVDFRSVLGSVVDGWMGGGASTVIGGGFEDLGLFRSGPGGSTPSPGVPPAVLPPTTPSDFVPTVPVRMFDTRNGDGGRKGPLGQNETWTLAVKGRFGVPNGAIAVAFNLTATDATAGTFVTVWPGGTPRPGTSNLNPVTGSVRPNLVVVPLGAAGDVHLYNLAGQVHLVGDLVGYFVAGGSAGLTPLTPARLLDTRDGTGGVLGPVGPGASIDLLVAGRLGVSADCVGVALNVTVTEPTASSYVTVWPTGQPRPGTSSVNMTAGQTIPNMVLSRVGEGGRISLYNHAGATHLVVDVLGCFDGSSSGRFVAVPPARLLDTRDGTGLPRGPLAQVPGSLRVLGRSGVPGSGVGAVLMNVTAVAPTAPTFVTVYPSGAARPLASNLNSLPGAVVPNMVLARVGADGNVMLHNHAGNVDLVADVVGFFTA